LSFPPPNAGASGTPPSPSQDADDVPDDLSAPPSFLGLFFLLFLFLFFLDDFDIFDLSSFVFVVIFSSAPSSRMEGNAGDDADLRKK
jgi:hypothetical protein